MPAGLEAGTAYVELFPRLAPTFAGDVERALKPTLSRIGDNLAKVGGQLSRKVTLPLAAGFAYGVVKSDALAKSLGEVVTLTGEVGTQADKTFGEFKRGVSDLSGELGVTQDVLTKGLYQALSSGVPRDNVFAFLEVAGKAAIGGVTDTETAVDGLSTVINAFGLDADDAGKVADSLFTTVKGGKTTFAELSASMFNVAPLANAAGVSFQEVNAALAALTVQGVPTAQATTGIRAALQGLLKPSAELDTIYKKAGFKDAADALKTDLGGAFNIVADATGGNIGKLTELVGSIEGVQTILGLTGDKADGFATALDNQANSVGALDDAFGEVDKHRSLDRLKVAGENFAITLGDTLLPVVLDLVDKITPLLTKFQDLDPATKNIAAGALLAVAALGPLLTVLGNLVKVAGGLIKVGKGAYNGIVGVGKAARATYGGIGRLVGGFRDADVAQSAFSGKLGTLGGKLRSLVSSIGGAASKLVSLGRTAVTSGIDVAKSFASMVANAARAAASVIAAIARQVASWIFMGAQSLLAAAKVAAAWLISMGPIALVIAAVVGLVYLIVRNWDTIKRVTAALWEGIKAGVSAAWEWIKNAVGTALNFLKTLFLNFTGPGLLIKHWSSIKAAAGAAVDWIKTKWNAFFTFFATLPAKVKSLASGMWDGIKDAFKGAINFVIRGWNSLEFKIPGFDPPGPGPKFGGFTLGVPNIPLVRHAGEAAGPIPGQPGQDVAAWLKAGELVSTPGQVRRGGKPAGDGMVNNFYGVDRPRSVIDELAWHFATS